MMMGMDNIMESMRARDVSLSETIRDLQDVRQFSGCTHDTMPQSLPVVSDGFDKQFTFRAKSGTKYDIIDLPVEETSLIRLFVHNFEPSTKVSVFLLAPATYEGSKKSNKLQNLREEA
jgi:hypothetical protein